MDITELRRPPVLPDEYFTLYEALEQKVRELPVVARSHNLALLHAVLAFEILAHRLRGLGEREIHALRRLGLPVAVTMFSLVMHGVHRGLTRLLRAVGNASVPDALPTEPQQQIQDEAIASLHTVNGLIELFAVMDDVALGWREFEVDGRNIRARSRSLPRFGRSIQSDIRHEAELNQSYLTESVGTPDSVELHQLLQLWALALPANVAFEPDDTLLDLAEVGTRRAGALLSRWVIPADTPVTGTFTAAEYRAGERIYEGARWRDANLR